MNKNNLIAGFFRYHREKLNYSQRGLIGDNKIVELSSLCDFENGKRTLKEEQLIYLFKQIGYDYQSVISSNDYLYEYQTILNYIWSGEIDNAIDLFYKCINNGVYDTIGALNFLLLDYLILVFWKKDISEIKPLIIKCSNLLIDDQFSILKVCDGKLFVFDGEQHNAILCFEEALHLTYDNQLRSWIYLNLGRVYSKCGDYYNAQKYTEEALQIYSKEMNFKRMIQANLNLGTICMNTNSYENAELVYKKALSTSFYLKDSNKIITKCFNNLCWLYFKTNQYDKFNQFSSEEIEGLVLNENTMFVLAWAYYKTGRVDECVKYCVEAREKYKEREYPQIVFTYIEHAVKGKKTGQDTLLKKAITMEDYQHNKEIDELFTMELIEIYERRKNYEKAYKYARKLLNR